MCCLFVWVGVFGLFVLFWYHQTKVFSVKLKIMKLKKYNERINAVLRLRFDRVDWCFTLKFTINNS